MASYRLFEKNPVTNEWIDRGFQDGDSQQAVIRKQGDGEYFVVPETSFHPVRKGKKEVSTWEYTSDGSAGEAVDAVEA